ncbi:MAG: zinc-ribbon domain-containing protein [Desulfobacterales bacterium]
MLLKTKDATPPAEKPAIRPAVQPSQQPDILTITCPSCSKSYNIRPEKIPPTAKAFKCKACGHRIALPTANVLPLKHESAPSDSTPAVRRSGKKIGLYAIAAGIILVIMIVAFTGLRFYKDREQPQFAPVSDKQKAALLEAGPFSELDLKVPLTLDNLDQRVKTALTPSAGPVAAEYADDPPLFTTVDEKSLKPKIPQIVKQGLFPEHYWSFGENPQMALDLDPVNIPNAALAELTYEVRSIQSPDGKDIQRAEENKFNPAINPGRALPGSIFLSVKTGTPPESLGTARIQFMLLLPDALQIFEFKSGEEKGRLKKSGGIQVTLGRLEKDVADVTYAGGKSVRLIAYDKTGKALASRESISASSSVSRRFQGIIDRLKVVVAASMLECPFEIEVDLNGGQEFRLSRKPEIPKRIRYNRHPVPTYSDFSNQDLENLAVTWRDAGEREWTDNLKIRLSKGPFSGQADWEVHFFGHNQPQFLTGTALQGASDISFRLEKSQLANVSAVFGMVQLKIRTDIKRLSFAKKEGGKPQTRDLSSGEPVTVSFNKNEVSYSTGKSQIIQVMAYDSFGKRLKQGNRSNSKGGKRKIYFWGQPASFEMDLSTKTLEKKIKFDIKQRPLNDKIYQKYKSTIDNHRDIVTTMKSVDRARRKDRSYYGDDLAGLYYLYYRNGKKPMKLFGKDIAHSDPAGQKRFGYKAKPYKGYYFTVLSGAEANGVNKEYARRSQKTKFVWEKGSVNTSALTRHPDLVAIPQDTSQPTFFLQWGQVFMKPLNGETLKYLPENYDKKGWKEAKFIES